MARVRGEGDRDRAARTRGELAARAEVVLHVTAAAGHTRVELTFELAEDLRVRLADDVREDVEAATVGHADDRLFDAVVDRGIEEEVEHRDQGLGALEAEPLLAQVLRVEESLECLGPVQSREDGFALERSDVALGPLDLLLDPRLLLDVLDVHVLEPDRSGVGVAQHAEDVAQRHRCAAREATGRELAVEVPDGEAPVDRVELRVGLGLLATERIEVGDQVAAHAVHVDELVHLQRLLGPTVRLVDR